MKSLDELTAEIVRTSRKAGRFDAVRALLARDRAEAVAELREEFRRFVDDCAPDAGSDDPVIYPPSAHALSKAYSALARAEGRTS